MAVAGRQSDVSGPSLKGFAREWNKAYSDPIRNIDWILIGAIAALAVIGVFTVYSATHLRLIDQGFDPFVYTQRQVIFLIVAAGAMSAMMWPIPPSSCTTTRRGGGSRCCTRAWSRACCRRRICSRG